MLQAVIKTTADGIKSLTLANEISINSAVAAIKKNRRPFLCPKELPLLGLYTLVQKKKEKKEKHDSLKVLSKQLLYKGRTETKC